METMGKEVDGALGEAGLWLPLSELARARNISKQVISKNLKRWGERGHAVATRKRGKELLVNVAEYDVARGNVGDLARQAAQETRAQGESSSYTSEQRRKMGYEADLKRIELQRARAELVPAGEVQGAAETWAEAIVQALEHVVTHADEITATANKEGKPGVRIALKRIVRDLRERVARDAERFVAAAMSAAEDFDREQ
jgi:hypothetical protein